MKWIKWLTIVAVTLAFLGCGGAWYQNWSAKNASYKNLDHLAFSWFGYKSVTAEDAQKSKEQGWWGVEVK
jgi:hypothetical protein